jgi:hypothetical protein
MIAKETQLYINCLQRKSRDRITVSALFPRRSSPSQAVPWNQLTTNHFLVSNIQRDSRREPTVNIWS